MVGKGEVEDILLMSVRTLLIKFPILAMTLVSAPCPNAGSYELGERLTVYQC